MKFGNNDISISIKGKSFNYLSGVLNTATVSKSYTTVSSSTYAEDAIPLIEGNVGKYAVYSDIRVTMGKGNEEKDAGQSFLPYFDSQNIELTIPAPLSGLELIYYNTPNYGGFVRPRISSINYLDYLLTTSNNDGDVEINGRS